MPLSADGFTLSHANDEIRQFWIDHCKASRRVSAYFGEQLGTPSVMNIWVPDGMKDITVDRFAPRQRLLNALDEVISEKLDQAHHIDAVESKLFGIGAESYTVGSNEFYMGYATSRQTALCLDAGHFHPTEVISDKISAAMLYIPRLLLHVSRPVRWDSDHVVLLDDTRYSRLGWLLMLGGFLGFLGWAALAPLDKGVAVSMVPRANPSSLASARAAGTRSPGRSKPLAMASRKRQ